MALLVIPGTLLLSSNTTATQPEHPETKAEVPLYDSAPELTDKEWLTYFDDDESYLHHTSLNNYRLSFPNLKAVVTGHIPDLVPENGLTSVFSVGYRHYYLDTTWDNPIAPVRALDLGNVETMNGTGLYDLGYDGTGLIIGIIDTGIYDTHQDFAGKIDAMVSFVDIAHGFDSDHNDPIDVTNGHGTHTASIAAGNSPIADEKGVAYGAHLKIADIDDPLHPQGATTEYAMVASFEWMLAQGDVDAINLSYGGGDTAGEDPTEVAISRVVAEGIFVACSAGNNGPEAYTHGSPSATDAAMAVAAVDDTGATVNMADFSSRGPNKDNHLKPDISAPGVGIRAAKMGTTSDYVLHKGTSMSSPMVAGAAALLIQATEDNGLDWNPGAIKAALMRSAVSVVAADYLDTGAGLCNIYGAYKELTVTSAVAADNVPLVMYVSNVVMPIDDLQRNVFPGFSTLFTPMVVSSHPDLVTTTITGTLAPHVTVEDPWTNYSRSVEVMLDLPEDFAEGPASFSVTFNNTEYAHGVSFSVIVVWADVLVGVDTMHTDWSADHVDSNSQYINIFEWGLANKIGFIEVSVGTLTTDVLDQFDIWWAPDPTNYDYPYAFEEDWTPVTHGEFSADEILALKTWVDAGGSLLVDFNGWSTQTVGTGVIDSGTVIESLNPLLNEFGVTAMPFIHGFSGDTAVVEKPYNVDHYVLEDVVKVDHFGGYFSEVTGDSIPLFYYNGNPMIAAYENDAACGRALFAHTNFLFDSVGFPDLYNAGTTNGQFVKNIFHWLGQENRTVSDFSVSTNTLNIEVTTLSSGIEDAALGVSGVVEMTDTSGTPTSADLSFTTVGATHTATFDVTDEGNYFVRIETEAELAARYRHVFDETAPVLATNAADGDVFAAGDRIWANVTEHVSGIDDVIMNINGVEKTVLESQGSSGKYYYPITSFFDSQGSMELSITVIDKAGNSFVSNSSIIFDFDGTYVPPVTSTTKPADTGDDDGSPGFAFLLVLATAALAATAVRRFRK